jgi:hypothetical protein
MNKTLMILGIAVLLIILGLSGCITSYDDIIIDDDYYQNAPRDHFVFNGVKLVGNLFFLNVSYGG